MTRRPPLFLALAALALSHPPALAGLAQAPREPRPVAPWPPPQGKLRVIIDADTANEIDDQHALALALGRPDRFQIEAIVAAHFGDAGGSRGIHKSVEETKRVLE